MTTFTSSSSSSKFCNSIIVCEDSLFRTSPYPSRGSSLTKKPSISLSRSNNSFFSHSEVPIVVKLFSDSSKEKSDSWLFNFSFFKSLASSIKSTVASYTPFLVNPKLSKPPP